MMTLNLNCLISNSIFTNRCKVSERLTSHLPTSRIFKHFLYTSFVKLFISYKFVFLVWICYFTMKMVWFDFADGHFIFVFTLLGLERNTKCNNNKNIFNRIMFYMYNMSDVYMYVCSILLTYEYILYDLY